MENDLLENCEDCYTCWAISICNICWVHLYKNEEKIDINTKRMFCENYKKSYLESLKRYATIIDYDANLLAKLESKFINKRIF